MLIVQFVDLLQSYNLINTINYMFDKRQISEPRERNRSESEAGALQVTGHTLFTPFRDTCLL